MEKIEGEVLTGQQHDLLYSITGGSNDPLSLPALFDNYDSLPVGKRKDLISLAETFETKFGEINHSGFKCSYLRIELTTYCTLNACPFRIDNKEFLNCSLYYHRVLKLKDGLSHLDIGAINKQSPKEIKIILDKSMLKVRRKILKDTVARDGYVEGSRSKSKVENKLEAKYKATMSNILKASLACFKDSDIIASTLRVSKNKLAILCEKFFNMDYDRCLALNNVSPGVALSKKKEKKLSPHFDSIARFKRFSSRLVGKYSSHCDTFTDLSRRLGQLN